MSETPAQPQVAQAPVQAPLPKQPDNRVAPRTVGNSAPQGAPDMAAKRAALVDALRAERGVPPPAEQPKAAEQAPAAPAAPAAAPTPAAPVVDPVAKWQAEYAAKQAELQAAEQRALQAKQAAEKQAAEAAEKLRRIELATSNPLEFLAETGMTESEWTEFLTNGGKLTPEQKRVREIEKQNAELQAKLQQVIENQTKSQQELVAKLEAEKFAAKIEQFPIVKHVGGVDTVRAKAAEMQARTGQAVSYEQAAAEVQRVWLGGLSQLLQDPKVRDILKLDTNVTKPNAEPVATSPQTLNSNMTSTTVASGSQRMSMEEKKQLFLKRLAEMSR